MESVSECVYRSDGTEIRGLNSAEWEKYLKKYKNVPLEDLIFIRDTTDDDKRKRCFDKMEFEFMAREINFRKGMEKVYGLPATTATPLFMLLSVHIKPKPTHNTKRWFSIFGHITTPGDMRSEKEFIYERESHDVEHFGSDGGYLTLNGPHDTCSGDEAYALLASRKLSIKLHDNRRRRITGNLRIVFDYSKNEFEEVKVVKVDTGEYLLTFKYVSIPMAAFGRLQLVIFNKLYLREPANIRDSVNVCGKVVATYKNTFGNYKLEEIVLFDKNSEKDEYQTLLIDSSKNFLFRWVALPAYSSLHVHLDLFEYGTNKPIFKEDVELKTYEGYGYSRKSVTDNFFVSMLASWFPPPRQLALYRGIRGKSTVIQGKSTVIRGKSKDADGSGRGKCKDGGGDGVQITGISEPRTVQTISAVEVFSVVICHTLSMPLKVYGPLQFTSLDCNDGGINIFKKDENDPLSLPGRGNTISAVNGSRLDEPVYPSSVICDLKDTLCKLSIKGYQSSTSRDLPSNRQLCSIFRGDHGFAALHYAIFPSAVQANLMVSCTENGLKCVDSPVSGSFCVEYNDFDYSSGYEKNCYKIVLFKVEEHDSVQVDANGFIPLSRASLIVPSHSSLLFDVQLMIGTKRLSGKGSIETDTGSMSIKKDQHEVKIDLNWSEVNEHM